MVINIFGRRGSGKTTTIRYQLKDCRPPILIVDVLGNFQASQFHAQGLPWEVAETDDLEEAILLLKDYQNGKIPKRDLARMPGGKFTLNLKTSDPGSGADYFSAAIWEINGGTLVLDEVDSIRMEEGSCFDEFIRYGRNHHGDLLTGCRRPAELSRNITAAANKFYCFQTHEYRDIEYFRAQVFGDSAEGLMTLPPYNGMFMNFDERKTGTFCIDRQGRVFHTGEVKTG